MSDWTAVILSGGRGSRMGNTEKSALQAGGRSLLDRVLAGTRPDVPVVVVGPRTGAERAVTFTLEEPRYGGPVAALAAALDEVETPVVAVVAVDMPDAPGVAEACVRRLAAQAEVDAVVPIDESGRRQPLCAAYRAEGLRLAIAGMGETSGRSMRDLLGRLRLDEWPLDAHGSSLVADIDTPEDLAGYRHAIGDSGG